MSELTVVEIGGLSGYVDESQMAYIRLEDAALGFGIVKVDKKGDTEYTRVNTQVLKRWLTPFGILNSENGNLPEYIAEPYFYLLGMKANNEVAREFQRKVAFEILPQIRKTGFYKAVGAQLPAIVKQLALSDKNYIRESLVPALIEAKVEQTTLIKALTGLNVMDYKGGGFGKAIENRLEINDFAARTLGMWRHYERRIYTIEDLPEVFRSGMARLWIDGESRKNKPFQTIVNYCGDIYFDLNGYRDILSMGIRRKIITRDSADEVIRDKTVLVRV